MPDHDPTTSRAVELAEIIDAEFEGEDVSVCLTAVEYVIAHQIFAQIPADQDEMVLDMVRSHIAVFLAEMRARTIPSLRQKGH